VNICIIPARGGSRRIPKKNIKPFLGKPIIAYSIEMAKKSNLFDRIIVSTDSEMIAKVAVEYGADVHYRSDDMSVDEVGTQAVIAHVLKDIGMTDGFACCIYATAPLMSIDDLIFGEMELFYRPDVDYVFSVGDEPLSDAGQFYWGKADAFIKGRRLVGENTVLVPVKKNRVCDINTMEDWNRAEEMYQAL